MQVRMAREFTVFANFRQWDVVSYPVQVGTNKGAAETSLGQRPFWVNVVAVFYLGLFRVSQRTLVLESGITGHVWTLRELLA